MPHFPPVPWPSWIHSPEPESLKNLPGGLVTAGTLAIVFVGVLWKICRAIAACCRRKKSIVVHEQASVDAGGARALRGCVGPKVVLVLEQEEEYKAPLEHCTPLLNPRSPLRAALVRWLQNSEHVICVPMTFPDGSELHNHEVWVVGITEGELNRACESYACQKKVDGKFLAKLFDTDERQASMETVTFHSNQVTWFGKRVTEVEKRRLEDRLRDPTGRFNIWLPYTSELYRKQLFEAPKEGRNFFSPNETVETILNVLFHATDSSGTPIFLGANEVGEIKAVFPLVDQEKDKQEFKEVLRQWRALCWCRLPPVEDLARLFGPAVAIYFSYMQLYTMALTVPAAAVILSLVYHILTRSRDELLQWGAVFSEGWSQATFALVLSTWSTLFFLLWRQRIISEMHRLGRDVHGTNAHGIYLHGLGGTHMFFKKRGFKLKKRSGIYINYLFSPTTIQAKKLLRGIITTFSMFLCLGISVLIIAGLCWISDKSSKVNYSTEEKVNTLLQNLVSVASYLVISFPLQGVYDKFTAFITDSEGRQEYQEYVMQLTRRRAFFQLVNYLGWFLYLGLFSKDMFALRSQLLVCFILKPSGLMGNFFECLSTLSFRPKDYKQDQLHEMIEQEWIKSPPSLFDEYLEVTIVFAAALCFAPVFPEGLIIAWFHTLFEYIADKAKLYTHLRIQIPSQNELNAISAWVDIWQGISWVAIFVSTWLVYVFLTTQNLAEQTDTWDPNPTMHWNFVGEFLTGLDPKYQTIFTVVLLEHFIIICKAYINVTAFGESRDVYRHREVVHEVLFENNHIVNENVRRRL
uniref:Anoctamin transmembrane domain-containing protein n=1 Tax=Pyrodinium bahamense TaxID=73915 RepID=A0A7S0AAK7_9DINO